MYSEELERGDCEIELNVEFKPCLFSDLVQYHCFGHSKVEPPGTTGMPSG